MPDTMSIDVTITNDKALPLKNSKRDKEEKEREKIKKKKKEQKNKTSKKFVLREYKSSNYSCGQ